MASIGGAGFRHVFDQDGTLANPLPVNPTTKQDMASVTKLVATASAVTTLSEAAGWLDTPVHHYLPRFTGGVKDLITIRDLLSHQAGLWEWWPIYIDLADDDPVSVAAELPLRYPRYHGYHYSDIGYMLLGGILENAFAAPLDVVIRQHVLETCGLTETSYAKPIVDETGLDVMAGPVHGDEIERSRLLQGQPYRVPRHPSQFQQWRSHTLIDEVHDGNAFHAFGGVASHAGLFSSIPDLLRWGDCLNRSLAGDGPFNPVGSTQLFEPIQPQNPSLRLGVRTWPASTECSATVYGRAGFTGTYVAVLPDHEATVVTLCNRLHVPGHDAPSTSLDIWNDVLAAAHRYIDEVTGPIRDPVSIPTVRTTPWRPPLSSLTRSASVTASPEAPTSEVMAPTVAPAADASWGLGDRYALAAVGCRAHPLREPTERLCRPRTSRDQSGPWLALGSRGLKCRVARKPGR